ncbi:MAG: hypothetical protein AAF757_08165, partial [Cyanobacteria bacterium P01_D01_bin.116]
SPGSETRTEQTTSPQITEVNSNQLIQTTDETSPASETRTEQTISPQIPEVNSNQLIQTTGETSPGSEARTEQTISPQIPEVNSTDLIQTTDETSPGSETRTEQTISPQTSQTTGEIDSENITPLSVQTEENQEENSPSEVKDNNSVEKSKATQGFFTGGKVTESSGVNQPIGASDTIPAMLTPGEFVVNTKDTEENLPLLEHINQGGQLKDIIPSLQTSDTKQTEDIATNSQASKIKQAKDIATNPKVSEVEKREDISTNSEVCEVEEAEDIATNSEVCEVEETEENSSLVSPSLGLNIAKQRSLFPKNKHLAHSKNKNSGNFQKKSSSNNYSSPPLIFKKSSNNASEQMDFDTSDSWSNFEEIMNIGNNNNDFTNFNVANNNTSNTQFSPQSQTSSVVQKMSNINHNYAPNKQELYTDAKVQANDIIQQDGNQVENIINQAMNTPSDSNENDKIAFESLAREIYKRLRQELEIEKERQGNYFGRLPW